VTGSGSWSNERSATSARAALPHLLTVLLRAIGPRPSITIAEAPVTNLSAAMSTRRLIIAALLCGLAILVAFTVQVLLIRS
jgi:hypothetical protein